MRGRVARKIEARDYIDGRHDRAPRRVASYSTGTLHRAARKLDRTLRWGCNISPENMKLLRRGRTLTLLDPHGRPYSVVLMDYFGNIREQRLT